MSRRSRAQKTLANPDPIYNSRLVTLLISRVLQAGKKSLAQKIVYGALEIISTKTEENPVLLLEKAVKNVTPGVEVKARRVGAGQSSVERNLANRRKVGGPRRQPPVTSEKQNRVASLLANRKLKK